MPLPIMQVVGGCGDDEDDSGVEMMVKMMRRDIKEGAAAIAGI